MADHKPDIAKLTSLAFMLGRLVREGLRAKRGTPSGSLLRFEVLYYAKSHPKPMMLDIARYLCVTPPATTLLIDSLVKEKLIVRILDEHDRRIVRIDLTRKGDRFIARGIQGKEDSLKKLFSVLNGEERARMAALLEKIIGGKTENH